MTARRTVALTFFALAFALLLCAQPAQAGSIRAFIDGPIVLGDQIYAGGMLELRAIGQKSVYAVRLDGRQVALAYPSEGTADAPRDLVLQRDARGLFHLVAVRGASRRQELTMATVQPGLASLQPVRAAKGPEQTAEQSAAR